MMFGTNVDAFFAYVGSLAVFPRFLCDDERTSSS